MKIRDILESFIFEDRIDWLKTNYGPKIKAYIEANKRDMERHDINNVDKFIWVVTAEDPSRSHAYTQWMIQKILQKNFRIEDLLQVNRTLELFDQNKRSLENKDINQYKTLQELDQAVDQFKTHNIVKSTAEEAERERNQAILESEILYNGGDLLVVSPNSKFAAQYWGRGTDWCTAYGDPKGKHPTLTHNYFNSYNEQGPLYIVMGQSNGERYQFHWPSDQFMNARDKEINPNDLADKWPVLWKIFTPIAEKNNSLILNNSPSEEIQLAAVELDGLAIKYINNPTEKVQLAAVHEDGDAIQFIKNPIQKVQIRAIINNPNSIQFITDPTENVQFLAVTLNYRTLRHIKNPTEKVQMEAVKQDGRAIQYIENPSEEMQLAAVKRNGYAIRLIENPSEAVQLAAVKQDGYYIKWIENPSLSAQLAAVKQNADAIYWIKNPSEAVKRAAGLKT